MFHHSSTVDIKNYKYKIYKKDKGANFQKYPTNNKNHNPKTRAYYSNSNQ